MRTLTAIMEGRERTNFDSFSLLSSEIAQYQRKMSKKLPENVRNVLYILQKYEILDAIDVETIRDTNKSQLSRLAKQFNMSEEECISLSNMLKELGKNIRLLPMFQTPTERAELEAGKLAMDDVTMDLDTPRGRDAVAKQWMPLVFKFADEYSKKSPLSKTELISAGTYGLAYAINTFKKPSVEKDNEFDKTFGDGGDESRTEDAKKAKTTSFKYWALWCVRNAILNEINRNSDLVKGAKAEDGGRAIVTSIDRDMNGDDVMLDRMADISETPDDELSKGEEAEWDYIKSVIDKNCSKRDANIFYRAKGLFGYKQEKLINLAKEFGVSSAYINQKIYTKVIDTIKRDPKAMRYLIHLHDVCTESILMSVYNGTKEEIFEALASDDLYVMLEDVTRWRDKRTLENALQNVLYNSDTALTKEDVIFIEDCLFRGFEYLDDNYRKNKRAIVVFLDALYPTESFARKSDIYILEKMNDIISLCKEFKIEL